MADKKQRENGVILGNVRNNTQQTNLGPNGLLAIDQFVKYYLSTL